ncbi:MAG: hypothetical protein AAGA01_14195 [Cyanobacteria bacterium P01_E01_bin.43]
MAKGARWAKATTWVLVPAQLWLKFIATHNTNTLAISMRLGTAPCVSSATIATTLAPNLGIGEMR